MFPEARDRPQYISTAIIARAFVKSWEKFGGGGGYQELERKYIFTGERESRVKITGDRKRAKELTGGTAPFWDRMHKCLLSRRCTMMQPVVGNILPERALTP